MNEIQISINLKEGTVEIKAAPEVEAQELKIDKKKTTSCVEKAIYEGKATLNQERLKHGLRPIEGGDVTLVTTTLNSES